MELVTGKRAREAATVMEGMLKAIDARFSSPTPRSLGLAVSDAVDRVFAKAVAHKPEDRWENLGAFWSALVTAKRASAILPHVDTQTTIAEDMPAGAREEALRRAADFMASGGSTKGATVGMQPSSTASPDSTMRMPGAPSASAMPIRTLPLDAKIPNVPASVVAPPRVEAPRVEPPRESPPSASETRSRSAEALVVARDRHAHRRDDARGRRVCDRSRVDALSDARALRYRRCR